MVFLKVQPIPHERFLENKCCFKKQHFDLFINHSRPSENLLSFFLLQATKKSCWPSEILHLSVPLTTSIYSCQNLILQVIGQTCLQGNTCLTICWKLHSLSGKKELSIDKQIHLYLMLSYNAAEETTDKNCLKKLLSNFFYWRTWTCTYVTDLGESKKYIIKGASKRNIFWHHSFSCNFSCEDPPKFAFWGCIMRKSLNWLV